MLKTVSVKIADIYIPSARRQELNQEKLDALTESLLNGASRRPIRVRKGKGRFVLVDGVHRLEASRAVGDMEIEAYVVQAPRF